MPDDPSNISREQFEKIRSILEAAKKKTRPRSLDLYDIFCAVLYVLKTGCQWRALPHDFPKWYSVYAYFRIWTAKKDNEDSILETVLKKIVTLVRVQDNRTPKTSFCIIDAQSVKNSDTAEEKGYDAGKKVSGIKRHIAVYTNGLPHAIHVTTANVTDRDGSLLMFDNAKDNLSEVLNLLADGGYTGEKFATKVLEILNATVEVAKRSELHTFAVISKRWVVERSFSWLDKCHRLWKNCERKINTSLHMVILAFVGLLLIRL